MESRKNPKLELQRKTPLYFQIGLLITMALVVGAFEWKTEAGEEPVFEPAQLQSDLDNYIPVTTIDDPEPPKPKPNIQPPRMSTNIVESKELENLAEEMVEPALESPDLPVSYTPEPPPEKAEEYRDYAEVMPEPVGGDEAFYSFLSKKIRYPSKARSLGIEGKVYVRFIVDENGKLSDLEVIRGIGAGCDEEVLRVLNLPNAPKWKPGRSGGYRVKVRMIVPVDFRLK